MGLRAGSVSPERAERPLVIALDVGSSSVRAALHDGRGRAIRGSEVQVRYAWDVAEGGSVRLPVATLLALVAHVLDELANAVGALADDVVAGGIACFLHSIVGLDDAGRAVTPVLSWADTTSAGEATALRARIDPSWVYARTGAPIHASHWPARIVRLQRERPDIRRWSGFPELLAESLSGRAVVSRSMASGTGLLDRSSGAWTEDLVEHLGTDVHRLPMLVADDEPIGRTSSVAARRWPRLAGVVWFAAWGDGACGNVGLRAVDGTTAALMVGTSGALRAMVAEPAPALGPGLFSYRLGPGSIVGGQLSEGGGVMAWASRLLRGSPRALAAAGAAMPPDAHQLTVLPYVTGERGPGYHDGARGVLVGLTQRTDGAAIYRAILESIGHAFGAIDDRLTATLGERPTIVASGGALARSPLLAQIVADSLARDISVAPSVESSRRGAALLALLGLGAIDALDAIPGPRTRTIRSDPSRSARYRLARARQEALYETILGPTTVGRATPDGAPSRPRAAIASSRVAP